MAPYVQFLGNSVAQTESSEFSQAVPGKVLGRFTSNRLFLQPR
jgi:hypothetical protein